MIPPFEDNQAIVTPRHRRARLWLTCTLLIFAISTGLSLIAPHYGGPDETAHFSYLYQVTHGNIPMDSDVQEAPSWIRDADPGCWLGQRSQPSTCASDVGTDTTPALISTTAANYPPLYYLMVGWPALFTQGAATLRFVRLLSSLTFASLAALGLAFLDMPRPKDARGSALALLAITPSAYALAGFVQPQALEIGAAIALAGLVLPIPLAPQEMRLRFALAIPTSFLLMLSRTTGPWWAVMICLLALASYPRQTVKAMIRCGWFWAFVGTSALWAGLSLAWTLGTKDWYEHHENAAPAETVCGLFDCIVPSAYNPARAIEATATTGWDDASAPSVLVLAYLATLLALFACAAWASAKRTLAVSALAVVIYFSSAIAMSLPWANLYGGAVWQGRYALPLFLPFLMHLAHASASGRDRPAAISVWLARITSLPLAALLTGLAISSMLRFWFGIPNDEGVGLLRAPLHAPCLAQIGLAILGIGVLALLAFVWFRTRPSVSATGTLDTPGGKAEAA